MHRFSALLVLLWSLVFSPSVYATITCDFKNVINAADGMSGTLHLNPASETYCSFLLLSNETDGMNAVVFSVSSQLSLSTTVSFFSYRADSPGYQGTFGPFAFASKTIVGNPVVVTYYGGQSGAEINYQFVRYDSKLSQGLTQKQMLYSSVVIPEDTSGYQNFDFNVQWDNVAGTGELDRSSYVMFFGLRPDTTYTGSIRMANTETDTFFTTLYANPNAPSSGQGRAVVLSQSSLANGDSFTFHGGAVTLIPFTDPFASLVATGPGQNQYILSVGSGDNTQNSVILRAYSNIFNESPNAANDYACQSPDDVIEIDASAAGITGRLLLPPHGSLSGFNYFCYFRFNNPLGIGIQFNPTLLQILPQSSGDVSFKILERQNVDGSRLIAGRFGCRYQEECGPLTGTLEVYGGPVSVSYLVKGAYDGETNSAGGFKISYSTFAITSDPSIVPPGLTSAEISSTHFLDFSTKGTALPLVGDSTIYLDIQGYPASVDPSDFWIDLDIPKGYYAVIRPAYFNLQSGDDFICITDKMAIGDDSLVKTCYSGDSGDPAVFRDPVTVAGGTVRVSLSSGSADEFTGGSFKVETKEIPSCEDCDDADPYYYTMCNQYATGACCFSPTVRSAANFNPMFGEGVARAANLSRPCMTAPVVDLLEPLTDYCLDPIDRFSRNRKLMYRVISLDGNVSSALTSTYEFRNLFSWNGPLSEYPPLELVSELRSLNGPDGFSLYNTTRDHVLAVDPLSTTDRWFGIEVSGYLSVDHFLFLNQGKWAGIGLDFIGAGVVGDYAYPIVGDLTGPNSNWYSYRFTLNGKDVARKVSTSPPYSQPLNLKGGQCLPFSLQVVVRAPGFHNGFLYNENQALVVKLTLSNSTVTKDAFLPPVSLHDRLSGPTLCSNPNPTDTVANPIPLELLYAKAAVSISGEFIGTSDASVRSCFVDKYTEAITSLVAGNIQPNATVETIRSDGLNDPWVLVTRFPLDDPSTAPYIERRLKKLSAAQLSTLLSSLNAGSGCGPSFSSTVTLYKFQALTLQDLDVKASSNGWPLFDTVRVDSIGTPLVTADTVIRLVEPADLERLTGKPPTVPRQFSYWNFNQHYNQWLTSTSVQSVHTKTSGFSVAGSIQLFESPETFGGSTSMTLLSCSSLRGSNGKPSWILELKVIAPGGGPTPQMVLVFGPPDAVSASSFAFNYGVWLHFVLSDYGGPNPSPVYGSFPLGFAPSMGIATAAQRFDGRVRCYIGRSYQPFKPDLGTFHGAVRALALFSSSAMYPDVMTQVTLPSLPVDKDHFPQRLSDPSHKKEFAVEDYRANLPLRLARPPYLQLVTNAKYDIFQFYDDPRLNRGSFEPYPLSFLNFYNPDFNSSAAPDYHTIYNLEHPPKLFSASSNGGFVVSAKVHILFDTATYAYNFLDNEAIMHCSNSIRNPLDSGADEHVFAFNLQIDRYYYQYYFEVIGGSSAGVQSKRFALASTGLPPGEYFEKWDTLSVRVHDYSPSSGQLRFTAYVNGHKSADVFVPMDGTNPLPDFQLLRDDVMTCSIGSAWEYQHVNFNGLVRSALVYDSPLTEQEFESVRLWNENLYIMRKGDPPYTMPDFSAGPYA